MRVCVCANVCPHVLYMYCIKEIMHTTVQAPRLKNHTDFLAKTFNARSFYMYMFLIQTERRMLIPLHACAAADTMLTSPSTAREAWSQKIGGNDLEPVRWSSQLLVRNGTCVVLHTEPLITMFTCTSHVSRVDGNGIPLIFRGFHYYGLVELF